MGTIFYNARPQKFVTAKNRPKFFAIFDNTSTLTANISVTDQRIKNQKSSWSSTTAATLGEKNWRTLVHKRKSY